MCQDALERPTQKNSDYCFRATATTLQNKGNNPKEKLAACHGDCDKDSDCKSGLKCFYRSSSEALVPGCDAGQSGDKATHDYCYKPSGDLELQYLGGSGCKSSKKCGECQGDCDSDNDCSNGLKCFQRNKGESVPGCAGTAHSDKSDYCYNKAAAASVLQANSSLVARSLQPKSSLAETNVHVAQQQLSAETNDHNAQQVKPTVARVLASAHPTQQSFFSKLWSWLP
jgi:hypothetical protein